jgi:CheY-like chemotaxis protein
MHEFHDPGANVETVLVVDGDALIRLAISEYLRHCGYRVFEAVSADEAITVLRKDNIRIDVVLSDVEMAGSMDGFGLARWVRTHRPSVNVLLAGTPKRAVDAAGDLCESGPMLGKPYDPQNVHDRIKKLLAARARQEYP